MRGTIQGIMHTPGSGIATVIILDEDGDVLGVPVDAGPLFRAISESGARTGAKIEWAETYFGTMASFTVVP